MQALNSRELETLLKYDGQLRFMGVFASDQLTDIKVLKPGGLILNTDPASLPGTHWISIYFQSDGVSQYLCSGGTEPWGPLRSFLEKNSTSTQYNTNILQPRHSQLCGYYSAFHLIAACRGHSLKQIVKKFDYNTPHLNDQVVKYFIYNYLEAV